jgi:DNA/RNA-binding domain of Phe-tRNA-synthetase-like protein
MKLKIDAKIFENFPELKLGAVTAKNIDNHGVSDEIMQLIREKEREIRENYDTETLSQHPKINSWRGAYSSFGAKPKKYKSSVESLYRMILKGLDLRHINKIVDLFNYISIKYMIPAGGDDMAKVDGDITLKFAVGDEAFTALNSKEKGTAKEGEVVYADSNILVVEALPPMTKEELDEAEEDLSRLITKYCGGEIRIDILDETKREIEI